jgi:hypothetical protein
MSAEYEDKTYQAFGAVGNNVVVDTTVALINAPGPGRYKIWGYGRHTLADGLKINSPVIPELRFSSAAGVPFDFGPIIYDITSSVSGVIIALAVPTGAADTASCTVYAQRLDS